MKPASPTTIQQAKQSPSETFQDPGEVLENPDFTDDQKLKILTQWKDEAEQLEAATAEGMDRGGASMLRSINLALESLKKS